MSCFSFSWRRNLFGFQWYEGTGKCKTCSFLGLFTSVILKHLKDQDITAVKYSEIDEITVSGIAFLYVISK